MTKNRLLYLLELQIFDTQKLAITASVSKHPFRLPGAAPPLPCFTGRK